MTKDEILRAIEKLDEKAISYYLYGNEKTISEIKDLVPKHIECVVVPSDYIEDYKLYAIQKINWSMEYIRYQVII